jgi:hypothetical protein
VNGVRRPRLVGELVIVALLVLVYDRVRDFSGARPARAIENAQHVLGLERLTHIGVERAANDWLAAHRLIQDVASWYYQLAHLTVTLLVLLWVWWRRAAGYRALRNVLIGINVIALAVFWVFPVAPPRLLPAGGYIDSAVVSGVVDRTTTVAPDLYAAMPSLHAAWAVWVMVALFRLSRSRVVRGAGVLHLALTCAVVTATANHYLADVAAGAGLTVVVLALVRRVGEAPELVPEPRTAVTASTG